MPRLPVAHPLRLGLFYDGVTFKLVSDHYRYEHGRQSRLCFHGLASFVEARLGRTWGQCTVSESHLFIGVPPISPAFLGAMLHAGVEAHLRPRNLHREKGVDMDLGLEMYSAGVTRRIDAAVLLATDGDFAPLAQRMKALRVPVILLGFHLPHAKPRPICLSAQLTDAVSGMLRMPEIIDHPPAGDRAIVDRLFLASVAGQVALPRCA